MTARPTLAIVVLALGAWANAVTAEEAGSPHSVEFGLGATVTEDGETAPTVWGSYQYRLNNSIGMGVLGEYAFGDLDAWIVGVPLTFHAGDHWKLVAMPGVEFLDGEREALFRLGAGYELELETVTMKPEINADFVDGEIDFVVGVSIGFGF